MVVRYAILSAVWAAGVLATVPGCGAVATRSREAWRLVPVWALVHGGAGDQVAEHVCVGGADGSVLIVGWTDNGGKDVYLMRVGSDGNLLWEESLGGAGNQLGYGGTVTREGGYVITGATTPMGQRSSDIYVAGIDDSGGLLWETALGGSGPDEGRFVLEISTGGYLIGGSASPQGIGGEKCYVARIDSRGDAVWERTFGPGDWDEANFGSVLPDGDILIGGSTERDGFRRVVYLAVVDESGAVLRETATSFEVMLDRRCGGVIGDSIALLGRAPVYEPTLLGLSSLSGEIEWTTGLPRHLYSIDGARVGGYVISGWEEGPDDRALLVRTDSSGSVTATASFGVEGEYCRFRSVKRLGDDGYIVAGDCRCTDRDVLIVMVRELCQDLGDDGTPGLYSVPCPPVESAWPLPSPEGEIDATRSVVVRSVDSEDNLAVFFTERGAAPEVGETVYVIKAGKVVAGYEVRRVFGELFGVALESLTPGTGVEVGDHGVFFVR